jgi:Mg-chelatase subunit ChlD
MNPESTPPEVDLEIRIVALLLGELSEAEAAELQARIDAEPSLRAVRDRLAATLGLVREAAQQPIETSGAPAEALKLPAEKRETLLAAFKTVRLPVASKQQGWKRYVPMGLAAALVGAIGVGLAGMMLPAFSRAKSRGLAANGPVSSGIIPAESARTASELAVRSGPDGGSAAYLASAVDYAYVTNSVSAGRAPLQRPASGRVAFESEAIQIPEAPRPQSAPAPTARSGPLAYQVDGGDKSREAGRMLADFGRVTAGEPTSLPPADFDVSGRAAPSSALPGQQGMEPGQTTWEFAGKDLNGRLGGASANAGAIDGLSVTTGPVTAGGGANAGTTYYFRDVRGANRISGSDGPKGGRAWSESASTRQSDFESKPGEVGQSGLGEPVFGDAPVVGTLFREKSDAKAAENSNKPALVQAQPGVENRSKLELAGNLFASESTVLSSVSGGEPLRTLNSQAGASFGGGAGGALGNSSQVFLGRNEMEELGLAGDPNAGSPRIIVAESKSANPTVSDESGKGFAWYLGRYKSESQPGAFESASGLNKAIRTDTLSDLTALADTETATTDESRFGLKAGQDAGVNLSFGTGLGGVVPQTPSANAPARSARARGSVIPDPTKSGDLLAVESADRKQVRLGLAVETLKRSDVDEAERVVSALEQRREGKAKTAEVLEKQLTERETKLAQTQVAFTKLPALQERLVDDVASAMPAKPKAPSPVPQPEVLVGENAFSTFSLNVSDVSFRLATESLEQGQMPDASSIRAEEFINAFDYRDPAPTSGSPLAFAWDRARSPFEHNRDFLRLSVQTASAGRSASQPLNLVVLLDNSGSMERADRVAIRREALRVLATQLRPQDRLSVVTFARTARLQADGVSGAQAAAVFGQVEGVTPEGGTNLEEAMGVAYATAQRHFLANGVNRVVLLTDGAANLGNVDPESLKRAVESSRRQGVALDCFGIGWEGLNDDLLETLSRNGDGRYGFLNSPEEAASGFAQQLAGALQVAASDVKVQVEFNPKRVTTYRQIGYAKHQLTKEQFRDNTVDAAEIGAAEAGNALYTMEVNPQGEGPIATVRVRFKVPGTQDYREHAWEVPFNGAAPALEQAKPAMRLAAAAAGFAEWLSDSPFAAEVSPTALRRVLVGVPEFFGANSRTKQLTDAVAAAGRLTGK